jgi:hypothetical protein
MNRAKEYTEEHTKLQKILQKYGNEEFGDCILDEICELFGHKLTPAEEEETVPYAYGFLKRKIRWENLCELVGVYYYALKEGFEISDSEVFHIKMSDAEKYGII